MKKALVLLVLCFLFSAHSEEIIDNVTTSDQPVMSLGLSPISLLSLMITNSDDTVKINDIWLSLSINIGSNKREYDYSIAKYPNYFSLGIEQRNFFNDKYSGFFYGPFTQFNMWMLSLDAGHYPNYSTDRYNSGDRYTLIGLKFGECIGFRIKIIDVGITPKVGISIPVFYLANLGSYSNEEKRNIYINNALSNALSIGLKVDFVQ